MILRTIVALLVVLMGCTGNRQTSKVEELTENSATTTLHSKSGLKIEYGPNLGTSHTDTQGIEHFYLHSTATITNDTTVSLHLQFAISNEYEFPAFCGDTNKYKVFVLPEELTPDTATLYNNIRWVWEREDDN